MNNKTSTVDVYKHLKVEQSIFKLTGKIFFKTNVFNAIMQKCNNAYL